MKKMKDYSKMTTDELVNEYDRLETGLEMNLLMDGSAELGGVISKGYYVDIEAIEDELSKRDYFKDQLYPEIYDDYDLPF